MRSIGRLEEVQLSDANMRIKNPGAGCYLANIC